MKSLEVLYKRDKSGKKVLSCEIKYGVTEGGDGTFFARQTGLVVRSTGFLDGKKQNYTDTILHSKSNRTIEEQVELKAQSYFNSKKDEGYKTLNDLGIVFEGEVSDKFRISFLLDCLPIDRTDALGVKKPMKCTATNDTKTGKLLPKVLAKIQYPANAQPKLDGVRCFATNYENGGFSFTSSSGKSYDVVCQHIKAELDALNLPVGTILDGELYQHGTPLEKISGWCRTTTRRIPEHDRMTFWVFDVPSKKVWDDRRIDLSNVCPTITHPSSKVQFLMTWTVNNFEDVQKLHDDWVEQGYEGAIIRNLIGKYAFGIRSSEIFKMKNFQDAEFKIVGYELGKRGSFDMIFKCITKDGKEFGAKPLGDAEKKEEYVRDFESQIKGEMGTVRYLNYSSYGIPVGNPVLKTIRNYE